MDISIVALIASIVSICLAFFAIWQANHRRDQSDKLNRDTSEKLARIEAFSTSTKEDAFGELKKWSEFARVGGKAAEETEKAKEEEMKKLKNEIQATTSAEINKVLETVESKLSSSTQASAITGIKKQFEELKKEIGKIQEKGLGEIERLKVEEKFKYWWDNLPKHLKSLLVELSKRPNITSEDLKRAGITRPSILEKLVRGWMDIGIVSEFVAWTEEDYGIILTPEFRQFLKSVKRNEVE